MTAARHLRHPGLALEPRVEVVSGMGWVFTLTLEAGSTLHEAIARPLLARGISSASLALGAMRLDPLVYYLPSVVEGPYLRFWYSEGQKPKGGGRLEMAHASFGRRDGEPFVHCHGIWLEDDDRWHGGHVVPTESVLADAVSARVCVLPNAALLSEPDAETEYQLFHPVPVEPQSSPDGGTRMTFARVKPNRDLTQAVEDVCRQAGYAHASVHGLGSLIGARFTDGTVLEDQGSEILLTRGEVRPGPDGTPRAELDICFSGFSGLASRGRLLRGENPVCITFELLIEEVSAAAR